MPVLHPRASSSAVSPALVGSLVAGLLEVLSGVPDQWRARGRWFPLVFVVAVATVRALAGVSSFR